MGCEWNLGMSATGDATTKTRTPQPAEPGMRTLMTVTELGLIAHETLRCGSVGSIVAAFESSCYAVIGGRWICIGAGSLGSGPLHALCDRLPARWPLVGSAVSVNGAILYVEGRPFATLEGASVWAPERAPNWTFDSLRAGLGAVDESWPAGQGLASIGGFARLDGKRSPMVAAAESGLAAVDSVVADALIGRAPSLDSRKELIGLIGLGPGLTPSGDDLLGGALIALAALDRLEARDVLWNACREHLARTNDISRAHLQTAALGYGAAALHAAIHATISGAVDKIRPALGAVSAIGHSSGRDSFAGVLIVLRALERRLVAGG